jgi:hypothetical protein
MDTFYAVPTSTTYTPLNSSTPVIVNGYVNPILPIKPILSPYISTYSTILHPTRPFYYDSGVGENPIVQYDTNENLRYQFLDEWLYEEYPKLLKKLQVGGSKVHVVSASEEKNNNISNDSESVLEKKSDFIGHEILTLSKNRKILESMIRKNNLKWYDLPHNKHYVMREQAKYVKRKLEELQEGK